MILHCWLYTHPKCSVKRWLQYPLCICKLMISNHSSHSCPEAQVSCFFSACYKTLHYIGTCEWPHCYGARALFDMRVSWCSGFGSWWGLRDLVEFFFSQNEYLWPLLFNWNLTLMVLKGCGLDFCQVPARFSFRRLWAHMLLPLPPLWWVEISPHPQH